MQLWQGAGTGELNQREEREIKDIEGRERTIKQLSAAVWQGLRTRRRLRQSTHRAKWANQNYNWEHKSA